MNLLCRAKRKDSGEWSDQDAAFIIVPDDDGRDAVYVGFCAYEKRIEVIGNIFDLDERGM